MLKTRGTFYANKPVAWSKLFVKQSAAILFLFLFIFPLKATAQGEECDEVLVTLQVKHIGRTELSSLICGQEVYLSIPELFDFLQIRNIPADDFSVVEGFFIDQDNTFRINDNNNQILYRNKTIALQEEDLIRTKTNLFLKSSFFGQIFGLESSFSFRSLSVAITTEVELPSVKAARRKKMRENIQELQNNFSADTTIVRDRPWFHFGTANWNLHSSQRTDGTVYSRFNLGLGGLFAGGEFTGGLNYSPNQELKLRNQFYQWRYVNNENKILRQVTAGKIGTRSVASIYDPVVGVQLTNAPTSLKKSFGTYVLSDYTEPDWMVELYINNVLVDYVQADATGFYTFDVPLMYGSTAVSLRYYGPWGEEEVSNRHFNIPFSFMPVNEFEYTLSSGLVEDGENNIFAQARVNYGLSRNITLGAGMEFLSSIENSPIIPFLSSSVRLPYNMLFSGEYLHDVGYKGNFSYTSPSNLRLEVNYAKYKEKQEAVRFSYLEERKATLSYPFRYGKFSGTTRFTVRQNLLKNNHYTNSEWLISGRAFGLNMNLTTNAYFNQYSDPLVYSRLSTSIRLPENFIFSPQVQYEFSSNSISSARVELRKQIFKKGYLQASFDQNFKYDQFYLNVGFTFELGFSRIGLASSTTSQYSSFSQSAGGSLIYEPHENYLKFDNRSVLGRGSVKFSPFLDTNGNGKKDELEPSIEGISVHSTGGGLRERTPDGATIYTGLEPYISYHFKLNTTNLDRIAWRVEKESMNIFINPNQLKVVEIPVSVVGEVAGFVYDSGNGIGGIKVNIFNEKNNLVTSILSEPDGFFSFLGLKSGVYIARPDQDQLEELDMRSENSFNFQIANTREGDYIDHLEFNLQQSEEDPDFLLDELWPLKEGPVAIEQANPSEHGSPEEISQEGKAYQETDELIYELLLTPMENDLQVRPKDEDKNSYSETSSRAEADSILNQLRREGFNEALIVPFRNGQRISLEEANTIEEKSSAKENEPVVEPVQGLVYKVQFETSLEQLGEDNPLFGDLKQFSSYEHKGIFKYTWGETTSRYEATKLQSEMRDQGFHRAFVVHFYNGKRITVEEALSIRENQKDLTEGSVNNSVTEAVAKESPTPPAEKEQKEEDTFQEGLVFRVQVMASKPRMSRDNPLFKGLTGVKEQWHEGLYKYTWGVSRSFREANQLKKQLRSQGFPDAFVVPFHNNKRLNQWQVQGKVLFRNENMDGIGGIKIRIYNSRQVVVASSLTETDGTFHVPGLVPGQYTAQLDSIQLNRIQMEATTTSLEFSIGKTTGVSTDTLEFVLEGPEGGTGEDPDDSGLLFRVQILSSGNRLPAGHSLFQDLKDVGLYEHGDVFRYTWGEARNLQEARKLQKKMIDRGYEDAVVIPFYNDAPMAIQGFAGRIVLDMNNELNGLEGIQLHLYDSNKHLVTTLISGAEGAFDFLGLRPGNYTAALDQEQLSQLNFNSKLSSLPFTIGRNIDERGPELLEFILEPDASEKKASSNPMDDRSWIFKVQVAASNVKLSVNHPALRGHSGIEVHRHEGMYKYTVGETSSLEEVKQIRDELKAKGFRNVFIVPFLDGVRGSIEEVESFIKKQN